MTHITSYSKYIFATSISFLFYSPSAWSAPNYKEIMANKEEYLEKYFSINVVDEKIQSTLNELTPAIKSYKEVKFSTVTIKDGKETLLTSKVKYKNLGNGYFRTVNESYSNGFQLSETYNLVFQGNLLNLRSQSVGFNNDTVSSILNTKAVVSIEPEISSPRANNNYTIELNHDVGDVVSECKSGGIYDSSTIHASISGNAIDLECSLKINSADNSIIKYTHLYDTGLLIYTGIKTPKQITTKKITEFEVIDY